MTTRTPSYVQLLQQLYRNYTAAVAMAENHEAHCAAADDLAELFRVNGHPGNVRGEADDDGVTLVVFTSCPPEHVVGFLKERGVVAAMIDFLDNDATTTATYNVRFHGCDIALVASTRKTTLRAAA